jgi:hypothetical protein
MNEAEVWQFLESKVVDSAYGIECESCGQLMIGGNIEWLDDAIMNPDLTISVYKIGQSIVASFNGAQATAHNWPMALAKSITKYIEELEKQK